MRNIGSSIGISVVEAVLTQAVQINHSVLVENITPTNPNFRALLGATGHATLSGMAAIDAEITRQAASIGYLDDFRMTMWLSFAAMPLALLLRTKRPNAAPQPQGEPVHAAME
jgi:DHA2 family multidrug resistance protein